MNINIIDQINSFGQALCVQPVSNDMISLKQLKARSFLAGQASRHYKIPELSQKKLKKKLQSPSKIQFKFQIEDDDYHPVLLELAQQQKNKNPLLPLQLQYKPNPTIRGLSIGRMGEDFGRPFTEQAYRSTLKTQKQSRETVRDSSQPILEEFNRQLSQSRINLNSTFKQFTDRSKSNKIHIGSTLSIKPSQREPFWVEYDSASTSQFIPRKHISQKQFNLYKNRNFAAPTLAIKFKSMKDEEQDTQKRFFREKAKEYEKAFFEQL